MKRCLAMLLACLLAVSSAAHAGNSLSRAAIAGDLKAVQKNLDDGEGVNDIDKWGWTALLWSIYYGMMPVALHLLDKGADPNLKSQKDYGAMPAGTTPLMIAAYYGHREALEGLIKKKADIEVASKDGKKALDYAKEYDQQAGPGEDGTLLADYFLGLTGKPTAVAAVKKEKPPVPAKPAVAVKPIAPVAAVKPKEPAAPVKTAVVDKDTTPPVISITSPQLQRGVKITTKEAFLTVTGKATDHSGVAMVTVNGQSADLDENGNFSAEILLKVGDNKVTVTAMDLYKNQGTETFSLTRPAGVVSKPKPAGPAAAGQPNNYALVIGINDYKYMDQLRTAVNDANEIARVLKEQYGYETRLLINEKATSSAILKELNAMRAKLKPADKFILYYAGHGLLDKQTDASYWLPVDAELNDDTNWLDTKRISDQLKRITSKQVLVIADSCYSGSISRSIDADLEGNDTRENYLKRLQEKPSRILIASGGNEPVADSGGNGHSVFADAFISALTDTDRASFTASELVTNRVREAVAGRANQTPECKIIRNSGHDAGDFVFQKK